jgi:hypothetical protein
VLKLAYTKSLEWENENEVRLLLGPTAYERVPRPNGCAWKMRNLPASAIKKIYLGCKAPPDFEAKFREIISSTPYKSVRFQRLNEHPSMFRVIKQVVIHTIHRPTVAGNSR